MISDKNGGEPCVENQTSSGFAAEAFRRIVMISAAAFWWIYFEQAAGEALCFNTTIDIIIIIILTFIGQINGLSWQDGALWLILSRRLHIDAAYGLEALPGIIQIAWIIFCVVWCFAKTERARFLLVLYHAGLTFDAGSARGFGMGMSVGWEAAPLTALLFAAALRRLNLFAREIRFPKGAVAFFIGLLYLLAIHRIDRSAHFTTAVAATFAASMLFLATMPPKEDIGLEETTAKNLENLGVLALSGVPLCLVAVQLGAADASSLAVFLQRRLYAGSLHPNLLALWSLVMLIAVWTSATWSFVPSQIRRPIRALVGLLYIIVFFGAGSRTVIITSIILCVFVFFSYRNFFNSYWRRLLVVCGLLIAVPMLFWKLFLSLSVGEWLLNERLFIWKAALANILEAPWSGYGILSYGYLPQTIDPDFGIWVYDWVYPHTHQAILEMLLWGGIPLAVTVAFAWLQFWRKSLTLSWRLAALSMTIVALFDFAFFTPSLTFLVLVTWFSTCHDVCIVKKAELNPIWKYPALVMGFFALFGVLETAEAKNQYLNALHCLNIGDAAWEKHLDTAIVAAPFSLELKLQRRLIKLSLAAEIDGKFKREIADLEKIWKKYYLLYYIDGRICELDGDDKEALECYKRSLAYEPRDLMGIRNARAAIVSEHLGKNAELYAWRAIQRGVLGAAYILDHPIYGPKFQKSLANRLAALRIKTFRDFLEACCAGLALAQRNARIVTFNFDKQPEMIKGITNYLQDSYKVVQLQWASESIGLSEVLASASKMLDEFFPGSLHSLAVMADAAHDYALLERITDRLARVWVYRGKNDEDMQLLWWRAHLAYVRNNFTESLFYLNKLNMMDPGNPWILEYIGKNLVLLGESEKASQSFKNALQVLPTAKLDPMFSNGPREIYTPAGDQWTFAFERAFRRFDAEAMEYNAKLWENFEERLKRQLAELR